MQIRGPYFSVGEKVILDSKVQPEFNGEYYIDEVTYYTPGHTLPDGSEIASGFYYHIRETNSHWKESALRKIHTGTGESWDKMLTELNSNNISKN